MPKNWLEAKGALISAEAEYLSVCGWVPNVVSSSAMGVSVVWNLPPSKTRYTQESALSQQKKMDKTRR